MLGSPEMSPQHYETLLPYAVALGVEKPWSQAFQKWLAAAAAAGVASKVLAKNEPARLGLIGAGVQAIHFLEAHRVLYPGIEVVVADIDGARAAAFAEKHNVRSVATQEAAASDIICIATPSRKPVIQADWVRPGAHINAMGADAEGKQELDPKILLTAEVYVDEFEQAEHSGEINVPLHDGVITREHITGTLGDALVGRLVPRKDPRTVTVFDSTGLAVQDLALASRIVANAGVAGVHVDIVEAVVSG